MKLRAFAIFVFLLGAISYALVSYFVPPRPSVNLTAEFVAATTAVTDDNFADIVLTSKQPVVLNFYGDYCGVCRQLEPEFAALARDHATRAVFVRVNVQQSPGLIERFDVRAVPTLIVLDQGDTLVHQSGVAALKAVQVALASAKPTTVR